MQENNKISLRTKLEQLTSKELGEMMRAEIRKPEPDIGRIKRILSILEARELENSPEMDARTEAAWERYQQRIAAEQAAQPKRVRRRRWIGRLATAAALVLILAVVAPQRVEANRFWDFLSRWKESTLEFFSSGDEFREQERKFETEHPGMQKVYDEAIQLGIDNPLIPMWFEEGYILGKVEKKNTAIADGVVASLLHGDREAVLVMDIYNEEKYHGYCRNDTYQESYEQDGVKFGITENNGKWVAVWNKDNTEYSLTIDCQEDTLRRILASIFVTEET